MAPRIATIGLAAFAMAAFAGDTIAEDRSAGRPSALGATAISGPPPRLEVPAVVVGSPASETSLGLAIGSSGPLPVNSYVRIRGLSPQMALTDGHVIAPGAWAVPVTSLPGLRIVIPAGASGRSDITITVIAVDGGIVAEAKTSLVVAAAALGQGAAPPSVAAPEASAPRATPPPAAAAPPRSGTTALSPAPAPQPSSSPSAAGLPPPARAPMSSADRERAEGFLARGRALLQSGNIASARLFFRRAADAGLAEGALAMGDTFDAIELDRLRAVGTHPDPTEARQWYEKARELGGGQPAQRRLERLGRR